MQLIELLSNMAQELQDAETPEATAETISQYGRIAVDADEAGIMLETARTGPLVPLFGHRQLLAQAISNLLENALNHGAIGGAVCLFAEQRGESQHIGVADRGPGIAPDQMDHALRRFGRLDESRSRPGMGLGLTLVQAIAHLHDGTLELTGNDPGLKAALRLPIKTHRVLDSEMQRP